LLPGADRETPQAARGTEIHAKLKNHIPRVELVGNGLPDLDTSTFISERPLVFNAKTGKSSLSPYGSKYGNDPECIYGTFDGAALTWDHSAVVVWDYKTGLEVDHPSENRQLRFYATALADIFNVRTAYAAIIYMKDEDDHEPYVVFNKMDDMDLDVNSVELIELVRRRNEALASGEASYKMGSHCKYCPSLPWCEPQGNMVRFAVQSAHEGTVTASELLEAYQAAAALDETLKLIWDAINSFATDSPIGPLENGKFYKEVPYSREFIKGPAAMAAIARTYGSEKAMEACQPSTTKAAIERVLGKADASVLFDELRKNGGIGEKTGMTFRESK
jgi:PD-(D/E)XK nuclease superfamily